MEFVVKESFAIFPAYSAKAYIFLIMGVLETKAALRALLGYFI